MSNQSKWSALTYSIAVFVLFQVGLNSSLHSAALPTTVQHPQTASPSIHEPQEAALKDAALHGPEAGPSASAAGETRRGQFQGQLAEAKTVLEDLRHFAEMAQRAIDTGRRIKALQSQNKAFQRSIAMQKASYIDLNNGLAKAQTEVDRLNKIIVKNWLASLRLDQRERNIDRRLAKARADWAGTALRLDRLLNEHDRHAVKSRELRAQGAALAAEIGRTTRQITHLRRSTLLIEDHRRAIQMVSRQLRREVSARLRAILVTD